MKSDEQMDHKDTVVTSRLCDNPVPLIQAWALEISLFQCSRVPDCGSRGQQPAQVPISQAAVRYISNDSLKPSDACTIQWTGLSLVQIKACYLSGTKPLPEPMLTYFNNSCLQLPHWKYQGVVSLLRCHLTRIGIPMLKITWSRDCLNGLIFNMGIPIPRKENLYIEKGT